MGERTAKRFWKVASPVESEDGHWGVRLDARDLRTPGKAHLRVPTSALALAIAAEWDAQEERIDPLTMPMTRSANSAIDKVAPQFRDVAALISEYGETDLCCYRADGPKALVAQQAEAWDPLLDWAASTLGAPLAPTTGIVPVDQPESSIAALRSQIDAQDPFALTALHDLVSLSGSLLIGLASIHAVFPDEELWRRSRIDETWQESRWGVDEEAAVAASKKRAAFLHAADFYRVSRGDAQNMIKNP